MPMSICTNAPNRQVDAPCPDSPGTGDVISMRTSLANHPPRPGLVIPLVLLGLLLIPQAAPAHPPSDLQLAFDGKTRVLSVTITHPVADPATHYVKRVLITSQGSTLGNTSYASQPASSPFTYTYELPPSSGGDIQVVAECSVFGSLGRSLQVTEETPGTGPASGTPAPDPSTPAASTSGPSDPSPRTGTLPPVSPPATEVPAGILPVAAALALAGWRLGR